MAGSDFRWQTVESAGQPTLFDVPAREIGIGEYRGLEFLHVRAKKIINEVGPKSPVPFRYTINAYRGCAMSCRYCMAPDTPVLMDDGQTLPIALLRPGDRVYGTRRAGNYRRYVLTTVLDKWTTVQHAYRVTLEDGTCLVTSGDHRFLTGRGWKHVTGCEQGRGRRPHLTLNNELLGTGHFAHAPKQDDDYRRGYLCGMIRGDGHIGATPYVRVDGSRGASRVLRLALTDVEALDRSQQYLGEFDIATTRSLFSAATSTRRELQAIRAYGSEKLSRVDDTIKWPTVASNQWLKGYLAGIFDAEGSCSQGVFRISNKDPEIIERVVMAMQQFDFKVVVESPKQNGVRNIRLVGGLRERLRFFLTTDPAISRKRDIEGVALKSNAPLRVVSIEDLGIELPMYDITTGTGDFIADGVVSHNCFARPTHEYLGLDPGTDFDRVIVVKTNAVERLRAELAPSRWGGHHIAMGTNTDPYQRAEGKYHLTSGIIDALSAARNPFSILTKGTLVLRDLDLLVEASKQTSVELCFSIGTLDPEVWRATEPGTPHPRQRIEAVAKLNDAGIPCGVLVAPILPGLSDSYEQLDEVVGACVDAGARSISPVLLHLRPGVKEHYLDWLKEARPDLLPQHRRLYPRAYAPGEERRRVTQLVHELIAKHRSRRGPSAGPRLSSRFDPA